MGERGPRPAPTQLKLLKGEKESRINRHEPVPARAQVCPPDWLRAEAVEVWQRLAPDLERKGVLTAWDVDAFAVLCDAIVQYREASALAAKAGVLIKGRRDEIVKSPAMQIVRDTAATIRAYAGEFGLTPSARGGLALGAGEEDDGHSPARLLT